MTERYVPLTTPEASQFFACSLREPTHPARRGEKRRRLYFEFICGLVIMDPGTALNVVSLGIQVCQGIVWYYQGWKGCPEDFAHTVRSVESLRKTLVLFQPILKTQLLGKA
jgi:hypothetical protein